MPPAASLFFLQTAGYELANAQTRMVDTRWELQEQIGHAPCICTLPPSPMLRHSLGASMILVLSAGDDTGSSRRLNRWKLILPASLR